MRTYPRAASLMADYTIRNLKDDVEDRCFEAGSDGLALLAFGAPKTDGQDAEMIPNWWSD
jgi:hypothetical protein